MAAELQQRVQEHVLTSVSPAWDVFGMLVFACTPAYLLVQAFAFWRMRGRYRLAFWLPVGAMALVYLAALLGVMAGSNLAPIWVVFASPLALIYVIVLLTFDFWRTSHASRAHR
jgi:heme A synthase